MMLLLNSVKDFSKKVTVFIKVQNGKSIIGIVSL